MNKKLTRPTWAIIAATIFALGWVLGFGAKRGFWSNETAAWVQAVLSVGALFWGVTLYRLQENAAEADRKRKSSDLAQTAGEMSLYALDLVAARLAAALITDKQQVRYFLRGKQTTEMIQALRELDIALLPPEAIKHYSYIRSAIYAINDRITEIFRSENKIESQLAKDIEISRRSSRLISSGRVLHVTMEHLDAFRATLRTRFEVELPPYKLPIELDDLIEKALSNCTSEAKD